MAKTLVALEKEKAYRFFYAPFVRVLLEGDDLLELGLEVISVSLDFFLEGMNQFNFVINNAFDIDKREFREASGRKLDEFFDFGRKIEVYMGYLDKASSKPGPNPPLFTGIITAVRTSFPSSGLPQITVSGHDLSYAMSKGKKSRPAWNDQTDSDVVPDIAKIYNLKPKVDPTKIKHAHINQSQETDRQFVEKLAKRNGFEFYIRNQELHFKRSNSNKAAILALEWGAGLVSFTPEVNLAEQISKVEVAGWNVNTKSEIIGRAQIKDEPGRDDRRKSGGEYLKQVCPPGEQPVHRLRLPAYTQEEANQRARAALKKASEEFVKGSGETIGIPELLPDTNIELKGLGKRFNKTYYVEKATHTVDASGYKTSFNVKETTI